MGTITDEAKSYEPKMTKNIADLDVVETNLEIKDVTAADKEGKEFSYKAVEIGGEDYRVPLTVLADLKAILEKKPDLKTFSVTKSGSGRDTRYTTIPQI